MVLLTQFSRVLYYHIAYIRSGLSRFVRNLVLSESSMCVNDRLRCLHRFQCGADLFFLLYCVNCDRYSLPIEGLGYFLQADRVVLVALPFD